jgi:hypothetical protein
MRAIDHAFRDRDIFPGSWLASISRAVKPESMQS